jgi:MFS family permease
VLNRITQSSAPGRPFSKRNFAANLGDGAFFSLAMSFVSLQTLLPVFVKKMGGDSIAVGLLPVLWTAGFNFPQIFIANFAQRFGRKKNLVLITALAQRLPWLLLAAISFFLDAVSPQTGLILFFTLFTVAAIAGSINLPAWFDLVAKSTPVDLRGRLFAMRLVLGSILGVFGGWMVTQVLEALAYPKSFALLFTLAFGTMMVSYVFLVLLKEESGEPSLQRHSFKTHLFSLPSILRRERNFRNFLVADALLIAATMAGAFYTVNAMEKFALAEAYAGKFTIVMMCSTIAGNLLFGYLADRFGHKLNLLLSAVFTGAACLIALFAESIQIYFMVFAGWAFTIGLTGVSRLPIIAEFCTEAKRPTYIALTNMITAPFVLAGLVGGWIAERFGYDTVFVITVALALAAAVWLQLMVVEPRKKIARSALEEVQYEA